MGSHWISKLGRGIVKIFMKITLIVKDRVVGVVVPIAV